MVTCKHFDKLLDDYLAGRLGRVRSFVFRVHMALCPPCKRYLEEYRKTVDAAHQCQHDAAPQPIPSEMADSIAKKMCQPPQSESDR